jgi:hypothetical protein
MNSPTCNRAQDCLTRTFPMKSSLDASALRKKVWTLASCLFGVVVLAGCASTKVTSSERADYGKLPRPDHILVYDFGASPADVPSDSALAGQAPVAVPSTEQATLGRQLGIQIAANLVKEITEMGLPAVQVSQGATPQINDIVIHGYLVSIDQGSAAKRMTIGFGSGGSELATLVEGYQMTPQGLRKLGSATIDAKGAKGPGAAVGGAGWLITGSPIGLIASSGMKIYGEASGSATVEGRAKATAKEIGERLKIRFKEQGWIN